jgi:biotin carboxylase
MLKSTAAAAASACACRRDAELDEAFASVDRLASANFKEAGVYLEKYVEPPATSKCRSSATAAAASPSASATARCSAATRR